MPELPIQSLLRLLREAAQRLLESCQPEDFADVLPVLQRAAAAATELYQPPPIVLTYYERSRANLPLFRALPPKSRRRANQVYAYLVGDPFDESGRPARPFYFFARWKGGGGECLLGKASMEELAVLLDRWARFVADEYSLQPTKDNACGTRGREQRYDTQNDRDVFGEQLLATTEPRPVSRLHFHPTTATHETARTSHCEGAESPKPTSGTEAARNKKSGTKATRNSKLESRDKWIYQQCCQSIAYKEIRSRLKSLCPKRGWRMIESIQGIRAAAAKYAERHHKPAPPNRQNL